MTLKSFETIMNVCISILSKNFNLFGLRVSLMHFIVFGVFLYLGIWLIYKLFSD